MIEDKTIEEAVRGDEILKCTPCLVRIEARTGGYDWDMGLKFLESKGMFEKKTGLEAFGAKKRVESEPVINENGKDEVEVIEPDEEHAPDCSVYETGECDCK